MGDSNFEFYEYADYDPSSSYVQALHDYQIDNQDGVNDGRQSDEDDFDVFEGSDDEGCEFQDMEEDFDGSKFWIPRGNNELKPCAGMVFLNLDIAESFYKNYAEQSGFVVRLSNKKINSQGTITNRYLVCSKEGSPSVKSFDTLEVVSGERTRRNTNFKRTGCVGVVKGHRIRKALKGGIHSSGGLVRDLKSPFVVRIVDFNVTAEDRRLHQWALASFGLKYDAVYHPQNGSSILRDALESLAAERTSVTARVINGWASILNYDERYRSRDLLRRHFFTMEVMGDPLLLIRNLDKKIHYDAFKQTLSSASQHQKDVINMKNIDLAFFPTYNGANLYLVVFNLRNPSITIVDNRFMKITNYDELLKRYGYVTEILQRMMVHHLQKVGHSAAIELREKKQERIEMEWQTHHNYNDSGLFVMRAMETYMGDTKTWKTGFAEEGQRQDNQLQDLKKKYVGKILMHISNQIKEKMIKEVDRFHSIDDDIKAQILRQSSDSRCERLHICI